MATNRDLLKEAIADAKAVKETAIANAKAALEEAFTPYLKEKLSAKLAEMEVDEEIELEENDISEVEKEKMDEKMKDEDMTEEVSLDELLAELDEESEMDENMEKEVYEAKDEEEEMNIEDMSEDDLKSFIEDVIKDMVSAGELEAGEAMEAGEEGEEEMEMETGEEEEIDEEINIDEILAELDEQYDEKAKDPSPKSKNLVFTKGKDEYVTDKTEEDDAPYSKEKAEKTAFYEADYDQYVTAAEAVKTALALLGGTAGLALSVEEIRNAMKEKGKEFGSWLKSKLKSAKPEMDEELQELRSELNEVNLLNAKLLYTNKIFRNKSLTESQKIKVITAFDKATTKQEAQLVYETLLESLKTPVAKTSIKESLGSASKVLGNAASKPIIEDNAFARMRELAFGKNK